MNHDASNAGSRLMVYRWNDDLVRWEFWSLMYSSWVGSAYPHPEERVPPGCDVLLTYENTWCEPMFEDSPSSSFSSVGAPI